MKFVGRVNEFSWLDRELAKVDDGQGRFVALRGRRQVGKSRLLTEWLRRKDCPTLYYQALDKPAEQELASFTSAVARSNLRTLPSIASTGAVWPTWASAFEALAVAAAPGGAPSAPMVVVFDEFPYLTANDPSLEATLQAAWDHTLQHLGILLIVVGSDLAMMEALATYGRPLYQRIDVQRQIDPLNVAEVGDLLAVDPKAAFDTYLMTGGFPKVVAARAEHGTDKKFLRAAVEDEAHPLIFTGEQMLNVEFPPTLSPRAVLEAIGAGERTFGKIQSRADVSERTLSTALDQLEAKRVISAEDPLSTRRITNRTRYTVADPYLRFWLRFLADRTGDVSRGRGDMVAADIDAAWQDYAGVAVEPLVRAALERLLPEERFGAARHAGAYWTRDHTVQVDLVGTKERAKADRVEFTGSIKWRSRRLFGTDDVASLEAVAGKVPGWDRSTLRVGVSRTGFTKNIDLDVTVGPDDLIEAWRS